MKKILLILPLILFVGCTNEVEENKYAYLEYKSELQKQEDFDEEVTDFNTYFNIKRENDEVISYSLIINDPNINMYKVKALLIHDFIQEDAFPSLGIMNEPRDLIEGTDNKIELNGTIQTTDDVSNVKFKLYLEYVDEKGLENKIYYQLSRG